MKHVFTIPPDVSFVDALAEGLWKDAGKNPLKLTEMLVFLPTRRACRNLREAFLRVTDGRAMLLPRMQPLGDVDETELYFTDDAADIDIPPAIPVLRRQMLLTQLITAKDASLPLDQATQLATALGDLLDQVQIERGDFANLEKLVPEDLALHWQDTLKFLEIVTAAWPEVLKSERCLDPAERRNQVLTAQARRWSDNPPAYPVIAAGSTGSMPAVAELLAVIAGLPKGQVILPGLDTQLDEDAWQEVKESHPQYGMRKWLELSGLNRADVKIWSLSISYISHRVRLLQEAMRPAEVTQAWRELKQSDISKSALDGFCRISFDNIQEEAEVIALRLRAALEEPQKTAALITPDRALAERVTAALRRWGIEANDSAGTALSALPVGSFLKDVLRAASPQASAIDYLSLLKHPLAACGVEISECRYNARQIEMRVWRGVRISNGLNGIIAELRKTDNKHLAQWLEKTNETINAITSIWFSPLPLALRIQQHMRLAENIASTDKISGAARLWLDEAGEAAAAWFADWQQAASGFPALSGDDYSSLFMSLLSGVTVRPAYGQHPRISILGPLEARLHHADLVILGELNEGVWPPSPAIDPWLSRPMKNKFGLPLPERRIGLSAHDFVQLASAPEVMITRACRVGGSPTVPSRFLLQTEAVLQALGYHDKANDALSSFIPWHLWSRKLDEPELQDIKPCERPTPRPPVEYRPKVLSVTEIGTWQRNPYAIYAKHILKLNKLDDIDEDVNAADRGDMVHKALERFLQLHKDKLSDASLEEILSIGSDIFAQFNDRPQVVAFWWPRFESIASWFIDKERERRFAGIKVHSVENRGEIYFKNGTFKLNGRADRIDMLPDGSVTIIDYKTGKVPESKDVLQGYDPQLPLLALIAEEGGFQGLGALHAGELNYWGLYGGRRGCEIKNIKNSAELIAAARAGLETLLEKFSSPDTAYEAVPKPRYSPKYDDYAHLARRDEWGKAGGDE